MTRILAIYTLILKIYSYIRFYTSIICTASRASSNIFLTIRIEESKTTELQGVFWGASGFYTIAAFISVPL